MKMKVKMKMKFKKKMDKFSAYSAINHNAAIRHWFARQDKPAA